MSVIVCEMTHSFNDLLEWFDFKFHSRNLQLKLQHESLKARVWNCAAEIISSNQFFFCNAKSLIMIVFNLKDISTLRKLCLMMNTLLWPILVYPSKSINRKCIFFAFSLSLGAIPVYLQWRNVYFIQVNITSNHLAIRNDCILFAKSIIKWAVLYQPTECYVYLFVDLMIAFVCSQFEIHSCVFFLPACVC